MRGHAKTGTQHKTTKDAREAAPSALDVISGKCAGKAALPSKVGKVRSLNRDPEATVKPAYVPLIDSLSVAPAPDLTSSQLDPASFKGIQIALLFKLMNEKGEFVEYEWESGVVKKGKVRESDSHVVVEVKFSDGKRDIDLSDGKKYSEDWVMLNELADGAAARKKHKPEGGVVDVTDEGGKGKKKKGAAGGDGKKEKKREREEEKATPATEPPKKKKKKKGK